MARTLAHTHSFTDDEVADIIARFTAGEPAQSIGAAYGLGSGKAIRRILIENDAFVPNRRFTGMFSLEDRAEIIRRYEAGETQRALGESYGCTGGNIRSLLVKENVYIRPMGRGPIDERSERIVRQMRDEGHPVEAIARHLSVPKYRVQMWVKELGLPSNVGKTMPEFWNSGSPRGYRVAYVSVDDPLHEMTGTGDTVLEHRLVMARALGRPLRKDETVHHINGVRSDNRLENLQLRQGDHGAGVVFACRDCGSHNVEPIPIAE